MCVCGWVGVAACDMLCVGGWGGEYVEWGGGRLWHNSILEEIF